MKGGYSFGGPRFQSTQHSWNNFVPQARSGRGGRVDYGQTGTSLTPQKRWDAQFQPQIPKINTPGSPTADLQKRFPDIFGAATDTPDATPAFGGVSDGMQDATYHPDPSAMAKADSASERAGASIVYDATQGRFGKSWDDEGSSLDAPLQTENNGINNIAQIWPRKGEAMATGKTVNGWVSTTPQQAQEISDTYATPVFSTKDLPY